MDPQLLHILLKENETIVSKVQIKLKLLRDQLAQVQRQRKLIETSLAEVRDASYVADHEGGTDEKEEALLKQHRGIHFTSEFYRIDWRSEKVDAKRRENASSTENINNHQRQRQGQEQNEEQQERRDEIIAAMTSKVRSIFPFPNDRIVWNKNAQTKLRKAVNDQVLLERRKQMKQQEQKQRATTTTITSSLDPATWSVKQWESIAAKVQSNDKYSKSSNLLLFPLSCRSHYLYLRHIEQRASNQLVINTKQSNNSSSKQEDVERIILKAFGFVEESNEEHETEKEEILNYNNNDDSAPSTHPRRELHFALDRFGFFTLPKAPNQQQIALLNNFEDQYLKTIASPAASSSSSSSNFVLIGDDGNDDDQDDAGKSQHSAETKKRNAIRELLRKCFDENLVFSQQHQHQRLLPIEKLALIVYARRELGLKPGTLRQYLTQEQKDGLQDLLLRIPSRESTDHVLDRFRTCRSLAVPIKHGDAISRLVTRVREWDIRQGKPPSISDLLESPFQQSIEHNLIWKKRMINNNDENDDQQQLDVHGEILNPVGMTLVLNLFAMLFLKKELTDSLVSFVADNIHEAFPENLQFDSIHQTTSSETTNNKTTKSAVTSSTVAKKKEIIDKIRERKEIVKNVQIFLNKKSLQLTRILCRFRTHTKDHQATSLLIDVTRNSLTARERNLGNLMKFISESLGMMKIFQGRGEHEREYQQEENDDENVPLMMTIVVTTRKVAQPKGRNQHQQNQNSDNGLVRMTEDEVRRAFFNQKPKYSVVKQKSGNVGESKKQNERKQNENNKKQNSKNKRMRNEDDDEVESDSDSDSDSGDEEDQDE